MYHEKDALRRQGQDEAREARLQRPRAATNQVRRRESSIVVASVEAKRIMSSSHVSPPPWMQARPRREFEVANWRRGIACRLAGLQDSV